MSRLTAIGEMAAGSRGPHSPYCPVQAVRDWQVVAGIAAGPLFRRVQRGDRVGRSRLTAQSVALIVKRLAGAVGLDPPATPATVSGAAF